MFLLGLGIGGSAVLGLVVWLAAKRVRSAQNRGFWGNDSLATGAALAFVFVFMALLSWSSIGAMQIVSEPIIGFSGGFVANMAAFFAAIRVMGRLPS
jgi:hypothetical protein